MTRNTIDSRILARYTRGNECEAFNISDLARLTKAAYPHVHAAVQQLVDEGVLVKRRFGRSDYCTVNLDSPLARALLDAALHRANEQFYRQPNIANLQRELSLLSTKEPRLLGALHTKDGILLLLTERAAVKSILKKTSLTHLSFSTPTELRLDARDRRGCFDGTTPLFGYERLLVELASIQEALVLNHANAFRSGGERR